MRRFIGFLLSGNASAEMRRMNAAETSLFSTDEKREAWLVSLGCTANVKRSYQWCLQQSNTHLGLLIEARRSRSSLDDMYDMFLRMTKRNDIVEFLSNETQSQSCSHFFSNICIEDMRGTTFHESFESKVLDHVRRIFAASEVSEEVVDTAVTHVGRQLQKRFNKETKNYRQLWDNHDSKSSEDTKKYLSSELIRTLKQNEPALFEKYWSISRQLGCTVHSHPQ